MTETETRYDMMYAVTTDGCGGIYIENQGGVIVGCHPEQDYGISGDDDEVIAGIIVDLMRTAMDQEQSMA